MTLQEKLEKLTYLKDTCSTREYNVLLYDIMLDPECSPALLERLQGAIDSEPEWLFAGADFASLEERIGAILSGDPERIKCYTDGYDGHSMRAFKYFTEQMPDLHDKIKAAETATRFWVDENGEYHCA